MTSVRHETARQQDGLRSRVNVRAPRFALACVALAIGLGTVPLTAQEPASPRALEAPQALQGEQERPGAKAATTGPSAVPCSTLQDCPIPKTVLIRGGPAELGDVDGTGTAYERPVRKLNLQSFAIGRYEVTFEQWDACHAAGGCPHRPSDYGWGRGQRPVIGVSWQDAQAYVAWLSRITQRRYRLPSEAEWEYAARAGTRTRYAWGDGSEWVCGAANVFDLSGRRRKPQWHWNVSCNDGYPFTAPVGRFPPNAWGLHDMHGNVWEWVEDCWHPDYSGAPSSGTPWIEQGDCRKRVNRGGGWSNHPRSMRSATRDADAPDARGDALGFRVVLEVPPQAGGTALTPMPQPRP